MRTTAFAIERKRYIEPGNYQTIAYECTYCHKIITLPQQQNFNYCMHCGTKVTRIGGKVQPRVTTKGEIIYAR